MIEIKVQGIKELQANLKDFSERRIRSTVATAMTQTAVAVRNEMQDRLKAAIDKPSPYTVRNLRYTPATARSLYATVGFDILAVQDMYGRVMRYEDQGRGETPVGKYMNDQIEGGPRRYKRFEKALQKVFALPQGWYVVPGARAKMDAYGNHSPGEIRQILSWFDAAELVAGSRQNMRAKGRQKRQQGTRKKAGWEYILVRPGEMRSWARVTNSGPGRGQHKMQPGIYRKSQGAMGPGLRATLQPIMIFVKSASYRSRWDFYGQARSAADRIYPVKIDAAIKQAREKLAARSAGNL